MLRNVLAVAGKPGLYKLLTQGRQMLIVEQLGTGKRGPLSPQEKVMSLGDIAMYTTEEDRPLGKILDAVYAKMEGKKIDVKALDGNDGLYAKFEEFVPDFDHDRVRPGDVKKLFSWYNILVDAGFTTFDEKKEEKEAE